MGKSKIEWTERVWNPVTGCTKISEGCLNCYAERMSKRFAGAWGLPEDNPFGVRLHRERLEQPFHWKDSRIFVCSMGDLFHDDVPDDFLDEVFFPMYVLDNHIWMVLTKRPERMKDYLSKKTPLGKHVWIGVTAENQKRADERIPILLQIPAEVRFVSIEPMLGPVSFRWFPAWPENAPTVAINPYNRGITNEYDGLRRIDWVICGGESGSGARPMHPEWVRSLRDQCTAANVPFFFKQWGEWADPYQTQISPEKYINTKYETVNSKNREQGVPNINLHRMGKKNAGRKLDGQIWDQYPEIGDGQDG